MRYKSLRPASKPIDAVIRLPGSKSLTNRALICAALADGTSNLVGALFSDDTELMIAALQGLGIGLTADPQRQAIAVQGCGGHLPATDADLYCGNSGTTIRFCTALCALGAGPYKLDGNDRMHMRPIGPLVDALRDAGALAGYLQNDGYPPVEVRRGGIRGTTLCFDSPDSSQFVSAMMMVAPYASDDMMIEVSGRVVSAPYLQMTAQVMDAFGVAVVDSIKPDAARFVIPAPQRYAARTYAIEPDATNASYFLAAPAVAGGRVTVTGLGTDSIQGDVAFVDILERMGCRVRRTDEHLTVEAPSDRRLQGIDIDLNAMPDLAQTLAVLALFAEGRTTIRNVANLRIKETDRLHALAVELDKLGARVELLDDGISILPPGVPTPARISTYDDHRMAMSFALAALAVDGVEIADPTCVNKTFPDFFARFEQLTR